MNNNSNNCGDCGTTCSECGRPWAICKQDGGCGCNKCKDIKFCEYGRMANGCIREKQPGCPMQAVIPSVTVESIEGIKNLADCLVHVSDINTTFYIDDKHRPIITWAGPIDIPGYDMEGNPNNYRDQIVTDVANQIAVIYDKSGKGYLFGLAENIDLQEQVNNKLDVMAEDGTLEEIITTYIQSNVSWTFDNVAEMQSATNLVAGSFARTLGYYSVNDEGGGVYYITDTGTPDGGKIISVGSLFANLVIDNVVNVKQYGAYGDGIHDDTTPIQTCIDNCPNRTIYFPKGKYLVSSGIITSADNDKSVCLKLDDYAVIKASSDFDTSTSVIDLGGKNYSNYFLYEDFARFGIEGGTIDCNNVASGVTLEHCVRGYIKNMVIDNVAIKGISLINGYNNNSLDANVNDCSIICNNNTSAIAMYINSSDNWVSKVKTFSGKYGFYFEMAGGNHLTETHSLATSRDYTSMSDAQNMCAYYFKSGGGNYNYFDKPYSDGYATAFYFDGTHTNYIRDAYVYYWKDEGDTNQHTAIQFSGTMTGRIDGIHCRFPSSGTNTVLKVANTSSVTGWLKELTIHNTLNLNDPNDLGFDARFNTDTKSLANTDIEKYGHESDTLTINYNGSTVQDHVVNLNLAFSGLTLATGNAAAIRLPVDFRPTGNVNIRAMMLSIPNSNNIIGYISSSGAVLLNPSTQINGSAVQIIGSYRNN